MGSDWFDLLAAIITFGHEYFWSLYVDIQSRFGQVVLLGIMGTFTPSQVTSNIILLCFLLLRRNNGISFRDLSLFILGKYIGLLISIEFVSFYGYSSFLFLTNYITMAIGPFIIITLIILVYIRHKHIQVNNKSAMIPLTIGFILSFYIDPVLRGISIRLPFLIYSNITNVIFPFIYTLMLVLPILILSLTAYGFELDQKLQNQSRNKEYIRYIAFVLLIFIAVSEIVIYWS
ncbi:hypothetical protein PY093_13505 [Cytobacillus sp. S13-E01]|uniref:hypothetical protein n=1 Tax=Cytobacillus sp. S13-E01 TaxID=3031326 RepID=UPI0023D7F9BC|nr:hypothetical protein [Cytobacillus sp. S13-E01]MDF0727692.1 hypothetical protein [Cytobacillus sp. S13-E01]